MHLFLDFSVHFYSETNQSPNDSIFLHGMILEFWAKRVLMMSQKGQKLKAIYFPSETKNLFSPLNIINASTNIIFH